MNLTGLRRRAHQRPTDPDRVQPTRSTRATALL